jgi:hypothetical protein
MMEKKGKKKKAKGRERGKMNFCRFDLVCKFKENKLCVKLPLNIMCG